MARLIAEVEARGMKLFTTIDHSAEARSAGWGSQTRLVVFGNPRTGAPNHASGAPGRARSAAEGAGAADPGRTCMSYIAPAELAARSQLSDELAAGLAGIDALTDAAIGGWGQDAAAQSNPGPQSRPGEGSSSRSVGAIAQAARGTQERLPTMASIEFKHVAKHYKDGFEAVRDIGLEVRDGEFVVLVGPSGSDESTALRMVAGLEDIADGELRIGGEIVNDRAPKDRNVAMVFQSYALYPHMTMRENMGFALKLAKVPRREFYRKVT